LTDVVLQQFIDTKDSTFFYTSSEHEQLITRTKSFYDSSTPAPTAVTAMNLMRLATLFDRGSLREHAEKVIAVYAPFFDKVPDQFSSFLSVLDAHLTPTSEIVFIADADADNWEEMLLAIHSGMILNSVVMLKDTSDVDDSISHKSPLLAQRDMIDGKPTVYICQNYTCENPITSIDDLNEAIDQMRVKA
jgi:uncharacterized protein YyaL (SSP411 family)